MALLIGRRLWPTRSVRILIGGLLVLALCRVEGATQRPVFDENQVKATFLFHFAHFVEWPAPAFAEAHMPITIGVLGRDVFGPVLDETVRDELVNNQPLAVKRFRSVEDIKTCHVLYISGSEAGHLGQILRALKGRPILTVGDTDGFARQGGMIQLVTLNNKVQMRVNLDAAKAVNLQLSSRLLRPAEIVGHNSDR